MKQKVKVLIGIFALASTAYAVDVVRNVSDSESDIFGKYRLESEKISPSEWAVAGRKHSPAQKSPKFNTAVANDGVSQKFQCVVSYSDNWDEWSSSSSIGVYTFESSSNISFNETFVSEDYTPSGGAFFTDRYYFITTYSEDWFSGEVSVTTYKYSRNDWSEISYAPQTISALYNAICYDTIDDLAYGFFYSEEGGAWGYMNPANLSVTHICTMEQALVAVAINEQGETYAVTSNGVLVSVDKHTGQMTEIGDTGLSPMYMQSAAFGTDSKMYWAASEAYTSGLYCVDITTGKAELVGTFDGTEEVCALYAVYQTPSSDAPAPVSNLKLDVSGDALTVPFSFTLPSKTYGGSALSAEVDYVVYVDGVSVESGKGEAGNDITITITVASPGFHVFKVVATNDAGTSLPSSARIWVGIDKPKPVREVKVEKTSDASVNISWEAPDGAVNDGYFSVDRLSYTVTRLPEGIVVADKIKVTEFTDNIDLTSGQMLVRYLVTPYADTVEGSSIKSDGIIMGKPYQTPVDFTFDTREDYNIFTVIDNNETLNFDSGMWLYTESGEAAGYKSGTKDGDDWLITPSVWLKGGTQYIFSHDVLCYSDDWPEEYEVFIGNSATIEGMTNQIIPKTTIWWDEYRTKSVVITVPSDGAYYFGFHATSDAGTVFFLIDNIQIRESYNLKAPAASENIVVTAGAKGADVASVAFTLPLKAVDGTDLEDNITAKVCRDEIVVKTFDNTAPGETLTFEDADLNEGMVEYEIIAANNFGEGPAASGKAWVGFDVPRAPLAAKVLLDAESHPVISWEAPEGVGVHGGYVDYSTVRYTVSTVRNGVMEILGDMISDFSCTDDKEVLSNEGAQAMHQYYVVPSSNSSLKYGDNATALYISGKNYSLPFKESFKDSKPTNFWAITGTDNEGWIIGDDWSYISQDDDDGMLAYHPAVPGIVTTAMSGKISLGSAANPTLTFYLSKFGIADNGFYDTDPDKDVLEIQVGVDGYELQTLKTIELKDITQLGQYSFYSIPLADLDVEDFVVVAFRYNAVSDRTPIMLDNITVKDMCDFNAILGEMNVPEAVEVLSEMNVEVNVINGGNNNLENVAVRLFRGEVVEDETIISELAPDQQTAVTLTAVATPEWGKEALFTVEVFADKDDIAGDNVSAPFSVEVLYHKMPAVSDLSGTVLDGKIELSWSEPDGLTSVETRVTETFDSYNHGDMSFGQWKSEDKSFWGFDGIKTITVDGVTIDIPNSDEAQAFMVFDPAAAGIDYSESPEWEPISGNNVLASFGDAANDDWEPNNDLLISPELSGKAQTISFYARTAAKKGKPDDIKIMTATEIEYNNNGTVKTSKFSALANGSINLTREWVKYEFELPAGTKYFAICNVSEDGFAVLIDDITYEPNVVKEYAGLLGYNIYRNGELVNHSPVVETSYTVEPAETGNYTVRAIYDEGESADSNVVTLETTGLSQIDAVSSDNVYYDLRGIQVNNPEPGKIYIHHNRKIIYRPR